MFDAIGEGHKIMHEGPKPELDLDAILAIVDGYDARMKIVREYFDRREPVPEEHKKYLATLADGEAVKAFEALRPLVWRVRELERQRVWLAEQVVFFKHKDVGSSRDTAAWIERAEQAAKEAVE